jgi:hypothetical protein
LGPEQAQDLDTHCAASAMAVCSTTLNLQWLLSSNATPLWCRSASLQEVLDDYKYFPGLSVHWVMVGPSDRESRPQGGGVLQAYDRCEGSAFHGTKIIANTYYAAHVTGHPHNLEFRYVSSHRPRTLMVAQSL